MRFFLSRTAHESASVFFKRAAEALLSAGVTDDFERRPFARGALFFSPAGVCVGYMAFSG